MDGDRCNIHHHPVQCVGGVNIVKRKTISIVAGFLFVAVNVFAQIENPVDIELIFRPAEVKPGSKVEGILVCNIAEGYHISDASSGLFRIEIEPVSGLVFDSPQYPAGIEDPYGTVYRGRVRIVIPGRVLDTAAAGLRSVEAGVTIQPCHEESGLCYAPETKNVSADLTVQSGATASSGGSGSIADRLTRALDSGSLAAFLIVFLGGLLTSLTPCVYPMIPITVAVIGAQASGGRMRGFVLSLFYVLGIAVTFSVLGFLAARTGALFGAVAQHPVAIILIASIFLLMGLSMLGLFAMQMPSSLTSKLQGKKRSGAIGAFLTGLLAGLIVSPCISPLLVVILTWVARSGSVVMGVGLLFSFALGLGVLFILVGTFSGILKTLPRSGGWMELIERGFGILLIVLAIVFLRPLLPTFIRFWVWAVFFTFLGAGLGGFRPFREDADRKQKIGKALGVLALFFSASLVFFGFVERYGLGSVNRVESKEAVIEESGWISSDEEGFREASRTEKPVLMDFYADWCAACRELDEKTWPDPMVRSETDRFVLVKLDLTRNDDRTREVQKKYGIIGMPTVIIFSSGGEEKTRFEGFRTPEEMVSILRNITP